MKKIRTLIVDDEPIAIQILETYLLKTQGFEIAGKSKNALEAFNVLNKEPIDLMLLDINMPEISGMHFLKSLKNPPYIVFTTAYSEFAAESYEHNAIDYLLKPISFERFSRALDKVIKAVHKKVSDAQMAERKADDMGAGPGEVIFLKSEGKLINIDLEALWLAEGLKDYIALRVGNSKIIVHATMKSLETLLTGKPNFIRIHKSYIVNVRYISEVSGNCIRIKDMDINIGHTYRESVGQSLRALRAI